MRGRWVCGLLVAVLAAAACSDDGTPPAEETTVTAAPAPALDVGDVDDLETVTGLGEPPANTDEVVIPEPVGVDAAVLQEALIAPVAYAGEPTVTFDPSMLGDAVVDGSIGAWVQIRLDADWYSRDNLVFCAWTEQRGLVDCRSMGTISSDRSWSLGVSMPPGDNVFEWWLRNDDGVGSRRLLRHETNSGVGAYELAPGFETVNAVLANPPPDGGGYLVPADPTTWEWPVELPTRVESARVEARIDRVDGPVYVAHADVETGVVADWRAVVSRDEPAPVAAGPFVVSLTGCELTGSGRVVFHGVFEPGVDTTLPLETRLGLTLFRGDMGNGGAVDVVFDRPGAFSVPLDQFRHLGDDDERMWSSRFDDLSGQTCELNVDRDGPGATDGGWHDATLDLQPLTVVAPAGSVESLARLADTTAPLGPHVAIATLLLHHADEIDGVDRLWLEPEVGPGSIRVKVEGACVEVRSDYEDAWIDQRRGCRELVRLDGASHMLGFFDGVWDVVVSGRTAEAATALVDRLAVMPLANAEPIDAADSSFDPVADLEAFYADRPEIAEFARVDWTDGPISIWLTRDGRGRLELNAVEAFVGGRWYSSGLSCFEFAVMDGVRYDRDGWAIFATTDLTATDVQFRFKDEPYEAALDRRGVDPVSGDELAWAFVELPTERQNWSTLITDAFHTPDGTVPCDQ